MSLRKTPVILDANDIEQQYYECLRNADLNGLMRLWADEDDVSCVHPGQPRLLGVGAIRASFEHLLGQGGLRIVPTCIKSVQTVDACVHNIIEQVINRDNEVQGFAIATNVYIKTAAGWRMVAHHASPATAQDAQEAMSLPRVVH